MQNGFLTFQIALRQTDICRFKLSNILAIEAGGGMTR
jgi:hypothetical protein